MNHELLFCFKAALAVLSGCQLVRMLRYVHIFEIKGNTIVVLGSFIHDGIHIYSCTG
jgi:hypothetical protein